MHKVTFHGLHLWGKYLFENLGWMVLHRPKRKMRQDYLFLYILKLCFK